jgi:hypothetical protein
MTEDFLSYYNLEDFLFGAVRNRFHKQRKLDAFDLFSIIVWKANRAKSKVAERLLQSHKPKNLDAVSEEFTRALFEAANAESRLIVAMKSWGFRLPMASAILTVLWPEDFTVYDIRACQQLGELNYGNFSNLGNINSAEQLWPKYLEYCDAVKKAVPQHPSLRDEDRFLWGRSAARQLVDDIARGFSKPAEPSRESPGPLVR